MATDSLNTRVFKVKNKNDSASTADNSVILKLVNSTAIAGMPSIIDSDAYIDKKTYTITTTNGPYDTDYENNNGGNARFKHIFSITSYYRNIPISVYYDYKYNDMLVMPNLDTIDTTLITSGVVSIDGYQLGNNKNTINVGRDLNNPVSPVILPEATEQTNGVSLVAYNLHGIINSSDIRLRVDLDGSNLYKKVNIITFVKIARKDLFGDNPIPLSIINTEELTKYTIRYGGFKSPDNIYIPIPV